MAAKPEPEPNPDEANASGPWIPKTPGEKLTGVLSGLDIGWSDYQGGEYPIMRITVDTGEERPVHGFSTVLKGEILKHKPKIGEYLTVTYLGLAAKAKPGMNPAKLYRIYVEGRESMDVASIYARLEGAQEPGPQEPKPQESKPQELEPATEPDVPADTPNEEEPPF